MNIFEAVVLGLAFIMLAVITFCSVMCMCFLYDIDDVIKEKKK